MNLWGCGADHRPEASSLDLIAEMRGEQDASDEAQWEWLRGIVARLPRLSDGDCVDRTAVLLAVGELRARLRARDAAPASEPAADRDAVSRIIAMGMFGVLEESVLGARVVEVCNATADAVLAALRAPASDALREALARLLSGPAVTVRDDAKGRRQSLEASLDRQVGIYPGFANLHATGWGEDEAEARRNLLEALAAALAPSRAPETA